jgi:hypothetical protein
MVFGGVPMRFYRMKTVKMQEEAAFFAPIDSSFKHASADPASAGVDGFNGLPRAEVRMDRMGHSWRWRRTSRL